VPPLDDLLRRARLTVEHHGWGTLAVRFLTAPLRPLGLERGVREGLRRHAERRQVVGWYRRQGRPVVIVVPTYGPPEVTFGTVRSLRKTTDPSRVRIVVVDDASAPEHRERLRALKSVELVLADENAGYAVSVNRGIERARPGDDIVVLNNDVIAHRHWLAQLQHAAYESDEVGIAGPRLLYPDGRIQSAGSYRNLAAPEWFDHRYRFRGAAFEAASVRADALAVTGACMYLRRDLIDAIGTFDPEYPMGYEDVDYCLRAWEAGRSSRYEPRATLTHLESPTRGTEVREREHRSQRRFWERWGSWFDERPVRTPEGALRVIYVTEGTGVGGGHRDVFEHLDRLRERGHDAVLFSLEGPPDWYPLEAPVRSFSTYGEMAAALAEEDAIKVATWWATAGSVWRGSLRRGRAVYFVQDIETSYYPGRDAYAVESRARVLASYREEFRFMTISHWNRERLAELNLEAELVPPGIDLETFRRVNLARRDDMLLALGRSNPLKNLPLTVEAWRLLEPRPELYLFGVEPELGRRYGTRYVQAPTDAGVNDLLNEATAFVQTSVHEGFCLPPLEAMAAGAPVVCTDAHGNRDFCRDGENCLLVEPEPTAVAAAIDRVRRERDLRERLVAGGLETVGGYAWELRIDQLERFLERVADERPEHSGAVPGRRVGES
jgi:GT2 family glycosyltransferase/glycosyltransferase involved in cell wall biosynthesis